MKSEYGTHSVFADGQDGTKHVFWPTGREDYTPAQHPRCMICGDDSRADNTLRFLPVCSNCRHNEHNHHKWDGEKRRWYLPEWQDRPQYRLAYFRRRDGGISENYIQRSETEGEWMVFDGVPVIPTGERKRLWKWDIRLIPTYSIVYNGNTVGEVFIPDEE